MRHSDIPEWANIFGAPRSSDQQFDDVIAAVASYNRRRPVPTVEQLREMQKQAKRDNPLHQKALARRRKRKRGGPK